MAEVAVPSIEVVPPSPTSTVLGVVAGGKVSNMDAGPSFGQLAAPEGAGKVGMLDGRTVEERIAAIPAEVDAASLPTVFASFALLQSAATAGSIEAGRMASVTADETMDGGPSLYFFDGTSLGNPLIR